MTAFGSNTARKTTTIQQFASIIGIVGAHAINEDEVELRRMSVDQSARGLGHGTRLVKQVEEHACLHGFKRVVLSTSACRRFGKKVRVDRY